jgi:cytochrome b561
MQFRNTVNSYGFIARALHWMTALVILAAFPLGVLANGQILTTDEGIRQAFLLFSLHKTTGILAFSLGIFRLFWTLSQPRPTPLHEKRRLENSVASMVHWTLTIALIAVPLAGWLSHSATSGLAPIWWPFGQSLPFVPKDDTLAERFATMHRLFTKVLLATVAIHFAGAIKHLLIDKDEIFARMWRGTASGPLGPQSQALPALAALVVWAAALIAGLAIDISQTDQTEYNATEWPIAKADLALVDNSGEILATASVSSILFVIDPNGGGIEKGTLDLTVPLDALEGPDANQIASDAVFPLLQFLSVIEGQTPTFTATGTLYSGVLAEPAEFSIAIETNGAIITGKAAVPGLPDTFLSINALAIRP